MRIYVLCDLEGVSGVVSFDTDTRPGKPNYQRSLRLAGAELSAMIRGLRRGGASDVIVLDGHGPGGLDVETITEPAEIRLGRPIIPPFGLQGDDYDAVVLFAHHSMAGTVGGNLCHSWSSAGIVECRLNDQPIGEIGWYCYLPGYFGKPVILITGDDKACAEGRRYVPNMVTACVKTGINASAAVCKSPPEARAIIEAASEDAVQRASSVEPVCPAGPYRATRMYLDPTPAEAFCTTHPQAERADARTIAVTSDDFLELTRAFL